MTEAEWLACEDVDAMIGFLFCVEGSAGSDRQHRLFVCSCCRSIWDLLLDERSQRAVECAEAFADGKRTDSELATAESEADAAVLAVLNKTWGNSPEHIAAVIAFCAAGSSSMDFYNIPYQVCDLREALGASERKDPCDILRDMFRNPVRAETSVTEADAWTNCTVTKLAQSIYDERAFGRLPILADALEDAGCDNADILAHCRSGGEHVRGCWVVDLLLGKS